MKKTLLLILISVGFLFSCQEDKVEPSSNLIGMWKFEYRELADGSKSTLVYSMLEHTYSDGFILNSNNKGNTLYGGSINDIEFTWTYNDSRLKITVPYTDGSTQDFEYTLSNIEDSTMFINTPKGFRYFIRKE